MDETTLTKTRFRKEQWKQLILDCQNSGMTILDWCAQQGVKNILIITGFAGYVKRSVMLFLWYKKKADLSVLKSSGYPLQFPV